MAGIVGAFVAGPRSVHPGLDRLGDWLAGRHGLATVRADGAGGGARLVALDWMAGDARSDADDGQVSCLVDGFFTNRETLQPGSDSASRAALDRYLSHGPRALADFDGHYVILVIDRRDGSVSLVSDPFANFPVFWSGDGEQFAFGPEIKCAALWPWVRREENWQAIAETLAFGQPWSDRTHLRDVRLMPPASLLRWRAGSLDLETLWTPAYPAQTDVMDARGAAAIIADEMDKAAAALAALPQPQALYLSGGLDSRLIAGFMAQAGIRFTAIAQHYDGKPATDSPSSCEIALALRKKWLPMDHLVARLPDALAEHLDRHDGTHTCAYLPAAMANDRIAGIARTIVNGNNGNQLFGDYVSKYTVTLARMTQSPDWGVDVQALAAMDGGDGVAAQAIFRLCATDWWANAPLLAPDVRKLCEGLFRHGFFDALAARPDLTGARRYEQLVLQQSARRFGTVDLHSRDHLMPVNAFFITRMADRLSAIPSDWKFSRLAEQTLMAERFPELVAISKTGGYPNIFRYPAPLEAPGPNAVDYWDGAHALGQALAAEITPRIAAIGERRDWLDRDGLAADWAAVRSGSAAPALNRVGNALSLDAFFARYIDAETRLPSLVLGDAEAVR
jgi:asparagine synthetase B (glutamine-hydrolysing)